MQGETVFEIMTAVLEVKVSVSKNVIDFAVFGIVILFPPGC